MALTPKKTFEMNDVQWHDLINAVYRIGVAAGQLDSQAVDLSLTGRNAEAEACKRESDEISSVRDKIVDAIDTRDLSDILAPLKNAANVITGDGTGVASDVPFWMLTPSDLKRLMDS